jgi:DNA polymerase III alpha subunit
MVRRPPRHFVHTHVHSDYSLLEGAAKIPDLVAAAHLLARELVYATLLTHYPCE